MAMNAYRASTTTAIQALSRSVDFNCHAIIHFSRQTRPILIEDGYSHVCDPDAFRRFFCFGFYQSPYFKAFDLGLLPALTQLDDLIASIPGFRSVDRSPHFSFRSNSLVDEICIAKGYSDGVTCLLLMRISGSDRFDTKDIDLLRSSSSYIQGELLRISQESELSFRNCECTNATISPIGCNTKRDMEVLERLPLARNLSRRELEVVTLALLGKSIEIIGDALGISPHTVRVHLRNSYAKLRVRSRLELFALYMSNTKLLHEDL